MLIKCSKFYLIFLFIIIFSFSQIRLFAELGMAGAEMPYKNDWYRNPALQNIDFPPQAFTASVSVPMGLLALLHPDTFPYETIQSGINQNLDIDLLSIYIQLSNPQLLILTLPESPDEVTIKISKEKIQIQDQFGNQIPLESIPGQGAFSVSHTPLFPPPVINFSFAWENVFIGFGIFSGSSGITITYDDNFEAMLSQMEIATGDNTSIQAEFSARTGIFEYINIISETIYLSNSLELQLAGRLLIYQIIAEVNTSASLDISIAEGYILSDFESDINLFYYYPGTGVGLGGRLDLGTVLRFNNWTIGLSILNLQGIEYSTGLKLQDDIYLQVDNIYYSFRPYFLSQASYNLNLNNELIIIPVLDLGYGKTLFTHAAVAVFWNDLSLKMGVTYEDRVKWAIGAGLRVGCFNLETGIVLQQSVFNNMLTGIFFSMGTD